MMRLAVLSAVVFALMLIGCAAEKPEPREPNLDLPPVSARLYDGPAPRIAVHSATERADIARIVEVTLTVPSGGHRLTLDHGDVVDGEAMLFLTVEQPARDDVVTMALETLRTRFETDRRFEGAKVHIRTHRRGEVPPADYRLAGQHGAAATRGGAGL